MKHIRVVFAASVAFTFACGVGASNSSSTNLAGRSISAVNISTAESAGANGSVCNSIWFGETADVQCASKDEIQVLAANSCAIFKLEIAGVDVSVTCPGGASKFRVDCCPPGVKAPNPPPEAPKPPPADRCQTVLVGDKQNCIAEDDIKVLAERTCSDRQSYAESISRGTECSAGGVKEFKTVCCPGAKP
jgi:hypothetical protein